MTEDQKHNVKFYMRDKVGTFTELIYTKSSVDEETNIQKNTAIGVINHEENKIPPTLSFLLRAVIGLSDAKEVFIRVSPAGVLPNFEKDQKSQHVQLTGWSEKKKKWVKVPIIETENGEWAIPVVIVGNQNK